MKLFYEESIKKYVVLGIVTGFISGSFYAFLMSLMNVFPIIASLVGSSDIMVGILIHFFISLFYGLVFTLVLYKIRIIRPEFNRNKNMILFSVFYGILIWFIGPASIMPLLINFDLSNLINLTSIIGHLFYSLLLIVLFFIFENKNLNQNFFIQIRITVKTSNNKNK